MCYSIFLSTDSARDLSKVSSTRLHFTQDLGDQYSEVLKLLSYPHRWVLMGEFGGCSCHFRHMLAENEKEFRGPQDWCPEEPGVVEATAQAYDVMKEVVEAGHKLDVMSLWEGAEVDDVEHLAVSFGEVSREQFWFFEDTRFEVTV